MVEVQGSQLAKKKKVLIIDDEAIILLGYKTLLTMNNYEVFTALSGEAAFSTLSRIDAPDLILLDFQLGDMSGPEFLLQLGEKRPDIMQRVPVVFVTGMDEVPASKAVGFIRKPTDNDKLLESVRRYIEAGTGPTPNSQLPTPKKSLFPNNGGL